MRDLNSLTTTVGWIVTFIEQKRGGGASAGYISSGFFGGMSDDVNNTLSSPMTNLFFVRAYAWPTYSDVAQSEGLLAFFLLCVVIH